MISIILWWLPFLFINFFINLAGPAGIGNVGSLQIEVLLVHLTSRFTRGAEHTPSALS